MFNNFRIYILPILVSLLIHAETATATVFTLDNWNTTELQTSLDTVTVIAGGDTLNGFTCDSNQLCIHWNDGAGTATPTVKAIIDFSYDDGSGATAAPSTTGATGGSTTWNFNGSGNADGFGVFDRNNDKGNGNETTAGITQWLVFTLDGVPSDLANWDFAAHVQYNDGCSGWVSDRIHPQPGSLPECDPPTSVPEPSTMILFGAGLVALGVWGRKKQRA
jgi:PEP-CTERM motif-containing protein